MGKKNFWQEKHSHDTFCIQSNNLVFRTFAILQTTTVILYKFKIFLGMQVTLRIAVDHLRNYLLFFFLAKFGASEQVYQTVNTSRSLLTTAMSK